MAQDFERRETAVVREKEKKKQQLSSKSLWALLSVRFVLLRFDAILSHWSPYPSTIFHEDWNSRYVDSWDVGTKQSNKKRITQKTKRISETIEFGGSLSNAPLLALTQYAVIKLMETEDMKLVRS